MIYLWNIQGKICSTGLHCFCDSSFQVYSSLIYIYYLICSKTEVSPMKEITIPRLELMSCFIKEIIIFEHHGLLRIIFEHGKYLLLV